MFKNNIFNAGSRTFQFKCARSFQNSKFIYKNIRQITLDNDNKIINDSANPNCKVNKQIFTFKTNNEKKNQYAFTFSFSPDSRHTPIGWSNSKEPKANNFISNPKFIKLLQSSIEKSIYNDPIFISEAQSLQNVSAGSGIFMHIYDQRNVPQTGRVPEVEDIFGSVFVDNEGNIKKNTYEANTMYRDFTLNGFPLLTDHMLSALREELSTFEKK